MESKADTKRREENSTETERDKKTNIAKKRIRKISQRGEANQFHSKTVGLIFTFQIYSISKKPVLKPCLNLSQVRQRAPVDS